MPSRAVQTSVFHGDVHPDNPPTAWPQPLILPNTAVLSREPWKRSAPADGAEGDIGTTVGFVAYLAHLDHYLLVIVVGGGGGVVEAATLLCGPSTRL